LVDIHVKHSTILNTEPIEESAAKAIQEWADGIIITWKWTGDVPNMEELQLVRSRVWYKVPIFTGSGATDKNIWILLTVANGAIIGTYFKTKLKAEHEVNIRSFEEMIDIEKVRSITKQLC
jgi:predicted TIM-barrel enzyme